jgi:hypothetical protein
VFQEAFQRRPLVQGVADGLAIGLCGR